MPRRSPKVTKTGAVATIIMVTLWVGGLSFGFYRPTSWVGVIINLPLGVPLYVGAVTVLGIVAAVIANANGRPFLVHPKDTA